MSDDVWSMYQTHKNYIDIQCIINGEEKIGVTNYKNCLIAEQYNEEKDIEFLNYSGDELYITMKKNEFIILHPQDAHKPSISIGKTQKVKKIVVKVAI